MRYRNYKNTSNSIWLIFIVFLMMGGFRLIISLFSLFFSFLPLILGFYFIYNIAKSFRTNSQINETLRSRSSEHKEFTELAIHIVSYIIKADRKIDSREISSVIQYFQARLGFDQRKIIWVSDLIQHALKQSYPLEVLCEEFKAKFNYESRLLLLELIYNTAAADGQLHSEEKKVIDYIVNLLDINIYDQKRIESLFQAQTNSCTINHYDILGIAPGASKQEIKKAYREAVKKYHPDKVHHLGPEYKKIAEEKMHAINASYECLMKEVENVR